jgi:hypothetical protein
VTSSEHLHTHRPGWRALVALTLGLGIAVAISWFAVALPFGLVDSFGLDLESMTRPRRLAIYALQVALVAGIGFAAGGRWLSGLSVRALAATVVLAWVLEGAVLTIIGDPLVANEIDPDRAWYYWLVATAGPLQPIAAFGAAWVGHRAAAPAGARS